MLQESNKTAKMCMKNYKYLIKTYSIKTEALESYISQTTLSGYACDACIPGHSSIQDALKVCAIIYMLCPIHNCVSF